MVEDGTLGEYKEYADDILIECNKCFMSYSPKKNKYGCPFCKEVGN